MQKVFFLLGLSFLFVFFCQTSAPSQFRLKNELAEVRTVFVDERSFEITFSSCGQRVGGKFVPCPKDNREREKFFEALKRWLVKYGFSLAADKKNADAVLLGEIQINDDVFERPLDRDRKNRKKGRIYESPSYWDINWSVRGWLENPSGEEIWNSLEGAVPGIAYNASEISKIEAKKLARKLEYDRRKAR